MASSPEICGSGGDAAACGGSLSLAGVTVCLAGAAGCGNYNFAFYMPEALAARPDTNVAAAFTKDKTDSDLKAGPYGSGLL